jgi:hypothetical protein
MRYEAMTMPTAKYAPWVSLLRDDSAYLGRTPASAYWALAPYYIGQFTESACSLASAVMLVNVGRAALTRTAGVKLVTQESILEGVDSPLWRTGVGQDGGGVTLRQLANLLGSSFAAVGLVPPAIEAVPLGAVTEEALAHFRATLAGEAGAGPHVIANFYMETVIGAGDYGHFSPIGAYDAARDRVLVLDVYRVELEPYWVPAECLFAGMATVNRADGEPRGYVTIRLPDR